MHILYLFGAHIIFIWCIYYIYLVHILYLYSAHIIFSIVLIRTLSLFGANIVLFCSDISLSSAYILSILHEFLVEFSFFSFICMCCRSLFVLLYFFLWPVYCRLFFDIRILITHLVSSNSYYSFCASIIFIWCAHYII